MGQVIVPFPLFLFVDPKLHWRGVWDTQLTSRSGVSRSADVDLHAVHISAVDTLDCGSEHDTFVGTSIKESRNCLNALSIGET